MNKQIITALGLLAMILLFYSCEDLLDVEESFTFQQDFVVDTQEQEFSHQELFDLAAEEDLIDEYGEKIKEVNIQEVRFWLTAHEGSEEQALTGGTLMVSDPGGESPVELASLGEHNLNALLNNPTVLDLNNAGVEHLRELAAEPPHRFVLHADGTVNEAPLDFTIRIKFWAEMLANPLN